MLTGISIKSTIIAKKAYPACFDTNSKGPRTQFLTKAAKNGSPKSSFNVREVRQAQVIDTDYKGKYLDFDPDNIIEYDQEETPLLDELCDQNQQKLEVLQDDIE